MELRACLRPLMRFGLGEIDSDPVMGHRHPPDRSGTQVGNRATLAALTAAPIQDGRALPCPAAGRDRVLVPWVMR